MLSVPRHLRRGGRKHNEAKYIEDGRDLLAYLSGILSLNDLGHRRLLDMGCGTKFTEAILKYGIPVGKYVGIDVYSEMIEFLRENVRDSRFSFHHIDIHNEMYNPGGQRYGAETVLPIAGERFDIISLFSVFTHLAPADYVNMLHLMRTCIADEGRLVFSLFLDEPSGTGYGLIEDIVKDSPWRPSGKPFFDAFPGKPLQWALYSREHALELIEGTGWKVERLLMPNELVQHHFICQPI